MPHSLENQLVVAVSSRALFDFEEENQVFEQANDEAYMALQWDRLQTPAHPGVAFGLVQKLMAFNAPGFPRVEVVVLSRNDPVSGLRVYHSAQHHGLAIERGVFTRGASPYKYLRPLSAHLFLSASADDVEAALQAGFPAAHVWVNAQQASGRYPNELRIAFDGDAVLFSDEAERIYQASGLEAFVDHEKSLANSPLPPGPFKPLLQALQALRQPGGADTDMRLRTALVTARSAPAHERAIRTLKSWQIDIDEAMFLGGMEKGPFLAEFEADFFFDDQTRHCASAAQAGPTGQVRAGIASGVAKA